MNIKRFLLAPLYALLPAVMYAQSPGYSGVTGGGGYTPDTPTITGGTGVGIVSIADADPLATIFYTTDGGAPTSSSIRYAGPFTLPASVASTVKAVAVNGGTSTVAALGPVTPTGNDPDVATWIANVSSASGTLSATDKAAANVFLTGLNAAGLRTKIVWLNLRVGDYAASKVPVIKDYGSNETHTNFSSSDYTEATGLKGDGSSKYLSTGVVPSTAGLSNAGASTFARILSAATTGNKALFCSYGGSGTEYVSFLDYNNSPPGPRVQSFSAFADTTPYGTFTPGFVVWNTNSATDRRCYVNGVQAGSILTGSQTGAPSTGAMNMFREVQYNGSYSDAAVTVSGIGLALTPQDAATLSFLVQQFDTAIGR